MVRLQCEHLRATVPAGSACRSCSRAHALITASYLAWYSGRPMRMLSRRLTLRIHALCAVYANWPRTMLLPYSTEQVNSHRKKAGQASSSLDDDGASSHGHDGVRKLTKG